MRFPIPSFVPVLNPEVMRVVSFLSLIAGICLVCTMALFLLTIGRTTEGKKKQFAWIFIGVGALLIFNYGIQLLF